jgi:hypothetical protein
MDQQDIEKLRAAGYTDDDIRDYMANQPKVSGAPTQTEAETLPEIDVTKPSDTLKQAEAAGVPTGARESSIISDVATAAPVVLGENVGKVALGAGGLGAAYAANQVRKGMQARAASGAAQAAAQAAQAQAAMEQARAAQQAAQGVQQRFEARAAAQAARAVPTGPQILDAAGRPMAPSAPVAPQGPVSTGPVAPSATAPMAQPAPQAQPSMLDKTTNMIRQLAANKVFNTMAKAGVGAAAALTPGNVGQDYMVPQTGRMRGMEINPMTGRPWTREQLQAYSANPAMYDQALGQAQMPR